MDRVRDLSDVLTGSGRGSAGSHKALGSSPGMADYSYKTNRSTQQVEVEDILGYLGSSKPSYETLDLVSKRKQNQRRLPCKLGVGSIT